MRSSVSGIVCVALVAAFAAGCSAGSAPPVTPAPGSQARLLSPASKAAALTSCSVAATEQPGQYGTVLQASAIGVNDMFFDYINPSDGGAGPLQVDQYSAGGGAIALPPPFSVNSFYGFLQALGDTDVWVAAYTMASSPLQIAHWNGASWTQVALSGPYASTFVPRGMNGQSSNDVWLSGEVTTGGGNRVALAHWNGSSFSIVGTAPYAGDAGPVLELSESNVVTTSSDYENAVYALLWNGSNFVYHLLPVVPGETDQSATPLQIAASGPNNIWIAGYQATTSEGRVWRYDGQWQPYVYENEGPAEFQGVTPLDATRAVLTSSQGPTLYGYDGTIRFHPISNDLPNAPTGPSDLVPKTQTFWIPTTINAQAALTLISCH